MTTRPARVLIVAGEASGDLYGSLVMRALLTRSAEAGRITPPTAGLSGVTFAGIGGPAMRSAGLDMLGDAGALGVTGLLEVVGRLPTIWSAFHRTAARLAGPGRPDLLLLIDYPDFNLRLARRAKGHGVPVLYFISPQVWAWRGGRVRQIASLVNRMLVILPFEESIYRDAGVPVEFVGHPLLDLARAERTREQTLRPLGLDARRPTIALLPGSRRNELAHHLPILLAAARLLKNEFRDLQTVVPVAPTLAVPELEAFLAAERRSAGVGAADLGAVLVREGRYDVLGACDAAAVASGTATLETALLGVPMVIVYHMNPLTFALARRVSRVPHVGMPNLIAGARIVPELVQQGCTPPAIARELRRILTDPAVAAAMRDALANVRARLGRPGAIERVASVAWDMIAARGPAA